MLARAEALQPELNCFVTLCGDEAIAAAREAERKVMAGERLGLLHGIPVTVKDIVNTKGVKTTFGAVPYKDNVPAEDAVAVARLRSEGAILIGKTTTPEFGSKCLTDSPLFGRTRNAWDACRSSGGSSGGAAVAVASGIAPLAIATDGGGSTRIPAACNGVVGLKQSNGVIPHSQALDVFGNQTYVTPTTRTVADTALMMQAMAGEDPIDPWSIGVPVPDFIGTAAPHGDLRGLRILYCLTPPGRPVSAEVAANFKVSLDRLAGLGGRARGILRRGVRHRADLARHQPHRLAHALCQACGRASGRTERGLPQAARARQRSQRHRLSGGDVRAHRVVPPRAIAACARSPAGDADADAHRAADQAGPVRQYRDRRQALRQRPAALVPLDNAVQHDRSPRDQPSLGLCPRRAADRAPTGRPFPGRCGIAARERSVRGVKRPSVPLAVLRRWRCSKELA
ncbi:Asp-tRNA(Asn)/Glu-tRNA(Gln) amidotransferase A subunit family amidase [Bradyrhizobium yuanmingense]